MTRRVAPAAVDPAGTAGVVTSRGADGVVAGGSRRLGWGLLVGGTAGLVAAFVLVVEKIALHGDSEYVPTCSINPVLNCGSIMQTAQAEVFGFPNPLIGVASFPVLMATGAALLAGAAFRRWYWWGLQAGVTFGAGFVAWLITQSLYRIGALCPYCMVVWAVVIPTFWYVTAHNLRSGMLGARIARSTAVRRIRDAHVLALTLVVLLVLGLILERFWTYWVSLL